MNSYNIKDLICFGTIFSNVIFLFSCALISYMKLVSCCWSKKSFMKRIYNFYNIVHKISISILKVIFITQVICAEQESISDLNDIMQILVNIIRIDCLNLLVLYLIGKKITQKRLLNTLCVTALMYQLRFIEQPFWLPIIFFCVNFICTSLRDIFVVLMKCDNINMTNFTLRICQPTGLIITMLCELNYLVLMGHVQEKSMVAAKIIIPLAVTILSVVDGYNYVSRNDVY